MFNSKRSSENSRNDRVETVIGEDTAIEGNVKTSGVVRIDGTLKGEGVCGGSMIIGETGRVEGNISAETIIVAGRVHGNISVKDRLEITETGRVIGDLSAKFLVMSEGGVFRGKSIMTDGEENGGARESLDDGRAAGSRGAGERKESEGQQKKNGQEKKQ